jgi:hypothetical protein
MVEPGGIDGLGTFPIYRTPLPTQRSGKQHQIERCLSATWAALVSNIRKHLPNANRIQQLQSHCASILIRSFRYTLSFLGWPLAFTSTTFSSLRFIFIFSFIFVFVFVST